MARRAALVFLGLAAPAVLVSFVVPGPAAGVLFAVLAMAFPVALIVLAVARDGRLGGLGPPLALLLVLLEGGVAAMLLLRGRVADGPWIGGLPAATAVMIYGLWLAPLVVVALAYALGFDRSGPRAEDLEELERRFRDPGESA